MSRRPNMSKDIYFAQIPEWVLFHEDLKPLDVRLYGVLCRYSEDHRFPTRRTLGQRLGVKSPRTIDTALANLETVGAITITHRFTDAGDPTSNHYTVHVVPPAEVAQEIAPPPATDCAGGGADPCTTGSAADCSQERESSSSSPLAPASRGTGDAATTTTGTCPTHPNGKPNCRACGTTPRQLEAQARRNAAARKRAADAAQTAAEIAARETVAPAPTDELDRLRRELAERTAATRAQSQVAR